MKDAYGSVRPYSNAEKEVGKPRWDSVEIPFYGDISLGNGTQYKFGLFKTPRNELFVGIEGRGCYTFRNYCHFTYAAEKLDLKFAGDAKNVADFINTQTGNILREDQGEYDDQFCV